MREHFPSHFHEAKSYCDSKTRQGHKREGNHRPISLRNRDAKLLNKILTNQIQRYNQRNIYYDQVGFIPRIQGWFDIHKSKLHYENKIKEKNRVIITINAETSTSIYEINTPDKVVCRKDTSLR